MKYALVTGGTRGIGKAIAAKLLESDYYVMLIYLNNEENAEQVYQELNKKYSNRVKILKCDLSKVENITLVFNEVLEITPKLDALILNAGKTDRSSFEEINFDNWQSVIDTNLTVPFFMVQKFVPLINANGSVLFVGSLMGLYPHSLSLSYGVTKSAVHALVKNLVKYLAEFKVRVNAVVPGFVDTDWQMEKPVAIRNNIENKVSLRRFADPEEIGDASAFLIKNNYINGELLVVDGGYSYR